MLRHANALVERARERIRAAAEHDPHAWPERDDDRAILLRDEDVPPATGGDLDDDPGDPGDDPGRLLADRPDGPAARERDERAPAPLGSPAPGAVDLDDVG